jgi:hypothetical protein
MADEPIPGKPSRACYSQSDGVELKEHLEMRLQALRDYIEAHLQAIDKASALSLATMDRRLAGMNEFREALRDTTARLATREELTIQIARTREMLDRADAEINDLKRYRATMEGKASQQSVTIALVLSVLGLAVGFIGLALRFMGG